MAPIQDSLLPKRNRRQEKQIKNLPARVSRRKSGSKVDKYSRYRRHIGKPLGPGVSGNKAGKHKVR
jgi:hypothetical protein